MKKKIIAFTLVAAMLAIAIVGGTLAYFTDDEAEENVFVMKGIDITLEEDFEPYSELIPNQKIEKAVRVINNENSTDAYVRVHIAIPSVLDDGNPSFAATNNFLHFNFSSGSVVFGQWSWNKTAAGDNYPGTGSDEWNFYTTTIDGIDYNVYVVTYESVLGSGEITGTDAIFQVYVDASVDADWDEESGQFVYTDNKGNTVTPDQFGKDGTVMIKVIAEGAQAATFANAHEALNTAFGVPGTAGYDPFN